MCHYSNTGEDVSKQVRGQTLDDKDVYVLQQAGEKRLSLPPPPPLPLPEPSPVSALCFSPPLYDAAELHNAAPTRCR